MITKALLCIFPLKSDHYLLCWRHAYSHAYSQAQSNEHAQVNMLSRITVSIVTYNSASVIAGCLESIPAHVPVMICDNRSTDNTLVVAKAVRPDVMIHRAHKNLGFGRAHNVNLKKAKTEFCLILNPDTRFLPGCFDALLSAADRFPEAAIIGAQHYEDDGVTPVVSIGNDPYCHIVLDRAPHNTRHAKKWPESVCCVEFIIGALMLFRMDAFAKTGFFDPRIFMYHEDVEICARLRKAGHSVLFEPLAKVVHLAGKSSGSSHFVTRLKQFYHSECKLIVFGKYHGGRVEMARFATKEFTTQLRRLLKAAFRLDVSGMHKHAAGIMGVLSGMNKV